MVKKDKTIQPIPDTLDNVADAIVKPAPPKFLKKNELNKQSANVPAPSGQFPLDLGVEVEKAVGGIEMGILENGIPYLTQIGLSEISGASRSLIYDISKDWEEHYDDQVLRKDRVSFLKRTLFSYGYTERKLYIETNKDGSVHYAYPDIVCMAVLEFYAFEAASPNDVAIQNFRRFAKYGLRRFIYEALGYVPSDKWQHYHDRVSLLKSSVPAGYFSVFHEISSLIVDLITADLTVNDKTVPDISVGRIWGQYWKDNSLSERFGERIDYEHNYPEYFTQAASNPQDASAYPEESLPVFRKWFREIYLRTKFPDYILRKAHMIGGKEEAKKIAGMYQEKQLPSK